MSTASLLQKLLEFCYNINSVRGELGSLLCYESFCILYPYLLEEVSLYAVCIYNGIRNCYLTDNSYNVLFIQAPFTPFLTELMYQNLKQLLVANQSSDNASIHYLMMPRAK